MSDKLRFALGLVIVGGILTALSIFGMLLGAKEAKAAAYSYQPISWSPYTNVKKDGSTVAHLKVKNTGTSTWCRDCANPTRLGTSNPNDRPSGFKASDWLSTSRIPMQQATVAPGQDADFVFHLQPLDWMTASYYEYFNVVVEGITWMPNWGIYWQWTVPAPVGVFYFNWYSRPEPGNGGYWTPLDTPNHDIVNYQYASNEDAVIRSNLTLIEQAGINFVYLDWWQQNLYITQNAVRVADIITNEFPNLKFAFFIEGDQPGFHPIAQYQYDYFWANFAQRSSYFKWKGKPLLATYCPRTVGNPIDNRFSHIQYCYNADGTWSQYWSRPPEIRGRVLSVFARYDDSYLCQIGARAQCKQVDPNLQGWNYNEQRDFALANKYQIDLITITAWNEMAERTNIEPHDDATTSYGPWYPYLWFKNELIPRWNND